MALGLHLRREAVYLLVCLRHHHETSAAMACKFGYELQLALKLQAAVEAWVRMAGGMASQQLKPYISVADDYVIVEDEGESPFYPAEPARRLFGRELLYLLVG